MKHDYLDQLFGLSGQTAVVVGGTGVLGGALADGLAAARAYVVVAVATPSVVRLELQLFVKLVETVTSLL